uniref:Cadherin Y-type LIR-motif domain-containing protein n=1 Tax=Knipowitschia caucasica TaxID=637954 RepID=A0AAV2L9W1_KNICA
MLLVSVAAIVVLFITLRRSKKEPLIHLGGGRAGERGHLRRRRGRGRRGGHRGLRHIALREPGRRGGTQIQTGRETGRQAAPQRRHGDAAPAVLSVDQADVHDFIKHKLTYAFEGQGSPAGTISPLDSFGTQSEQDYNYLDDWGPEFQKLAEIYGDADSDVTT